MGVLEGKRALVTGGSRGIGRSIVTRLAADGAEVAFSYLHRHSDAAEVAAAVEAAGGRAHPLQADLRQVPDLRQLFDQAGNRLGGLDILVNNVGLMLRATLRDTTEEQFDAMIALNAKVTFFAIQEAIKQMADGGRIVNISSTATVLGHPSQAAYGASKAAVEQITRVAARSLISRGITVNVVAPGGIETESSVGDASPEVIAQWRRPTATGRLGLPEDIADIVAFLAGPDSRWLTGQTIRAAGGAV